MFRQIEDQLQWRADLLQSGRYEDLAREYLFPLAVYLEDRLIVLPTPDAVMAAARHLNQALKARGVVRCHLRVTAIELPRKGRFRVWGSWMELATSPANCRQSDVIYYMRETEQGFRSEMLQFLRLGAKEMLEFSLSDRLIA